MIETVHLLTFFGGSVILWLRFINKADWSRKGEIESVLSVDQVRKSGGLFLASFLLGFVCFYFLKNWWFLAYGIICVILWIVVELKINRSKSTEIKKLKPMYPPHLDFSNNPMRFSSYGEAVDNLINQLTKEGYITSELKSLSSNAMIIEGIRRLQEALGFAEEQITGNYDQRTRRFHKQRTGFDANAVRSNGGITYYAQTGSVGSTIWPPLETSE